MTTSTSTLDQDAVLRLAVIVEAARDGKRVRFLSPVTEEIVTGVARHLVVGPDNYGFARGDVREAYLRVTLSSGLDIAMSVPEVADMLAARTFGIGN